MEASNAEVYHVFAIAILLSNLGREKEFAVSIWILRHSHDRHQLFESSNRQAEELEFAFEDGQNVIDH